MDVEQRLTAAAPAVRAERFGGLSVAVADEVLRTGHRPRRRWSRGWIAAAVAAAIVVPGTAVATGVHFAAETGRFGRPGMTENDTSQYIDMCAPDITEYVTTLVPGGVALPPGVTWAEVVDHLVTSGTQDCPPHGPGDTQDVTGIRSRLLIALQCPWEADMIHAAATGDTAEVRRAGQQIADDQDEVAAIGGFGDDGWKTYRDAADAGDVAAIAQSYRANDCAPYVASLGAVR